MTGKQITKWTLIVAILALLSGWLWQFLDSSKKNSRVNVSGNTQSIGNIASGNNSPVTVHQQINVKIENLNEKQT